MFPDPWTWLSVIPMTNVTTLSLVVVLLVSVLLKLSVKAVILVRLPFSLRKSTFLTIVLSYLRLSSLLILTSYNIAARISSRIMVLKSSMKLKLLKLILIVTSFKPRVNLTFTSISS